MKKRYLKTYAKKSISAFLALSLLCFLPAGNIRAEEGGGYGTDWPLLTGTSTLGSTAIDYYSGIAATDNGYIAVGNANGLDGDLTEYNAGGGGVITGYTDNGNTPEISWIKSLSSTEIMDRTKKSTGAVTHKESVNGVFFYHDICRLADGSYIVTGGCNADTFTDYTSENSTYLTTYTYTLKDNEGNSYTIDNWTDNTSGSNGVLIHLDSSGNIMGIQALGGSTDDDILTVSSTSDGGFIISGKTNSTDGDFTDITPAGTTDVDVGGFVGKYSSSLSKEWIKYYSDVNIRNVKQAPDGGYLMAANTTSSDPSAVITLKDSSGNTVTTYDVGDAIIFKTNADGIISRINRAGGSDNDIYNYIIPTSDGGYLAVGTSSSKDHDMADSSGNSLRKSDDTITDGSITTKGTDAIIAKYAADGSREWFKNYGGTSPVNEVYSVVQKSDGSYIVLGITNSQDGDIADADTSSSGSYDLWLLSVASDGTLSHSILLGGTGDDFYHTSFRLGQHYLIDTGTKYVIVGKTSSADGAFSLYQGNSDAFIAVFNYDYDGDGIPNILDYYPNDAALSYPPTGALDPAGTPVKTAGDGTSGSVSVSSSALLTADNGSALTAADIMTIKTSNAAFNVPLGLMYYLFNSNNVNNIIFNTTTSSESITTSGSESFITAFELNMTDADGNPLASTSFGGNIQVSFIIPASEAANYDSAKTTTLYYIADDGTRTEIPGASFVKNSDGSITVTFQTSHFSTYAIIQSEAAATAVNNPNNSDNPGGTTLTSSSVGTGDAGAGIYPWIMVIAALCIIGVVVSLVYRNRKNRTI